MSSSVRSTKEQQIIIRNFLQSNVREHPRDLVRLTQETFNLTKPAVMNYVNQLISENKIEVLGKTKDRKYSALLQKKKGGVHFLANGLEEGKLWNRYSDILDGIFDNVKNICQYGFTEIVNNAIEHSEGTKVSINIERYFDRIDLWIQDDGVGVFNKIQKQLNLDDPIYSILELSKGKLTTDPKHHTGEGIFFTSRMFDWFSIKSGKIHFTHTNPDTDVVDQDSKRLSGTLIIMQLKVPSDRTTKQVFDRFTEDDDSFGFDKTIIPVHLALYGDDQLISRSQAKRLLNRFEKFKHVVLDFKNVELIGQAFADEIFRIFVAAHPTIKISQINAIESVSDMINHVQANR